MQKVYVLDTSALLAFPDLMFRLDEEGNEIIIPRAVTRELQGLKHSEHLLVVEAAEKVLNSLKFFSESLFGANMPGGATISISEIYETIDDLASGADNEIVGAAIAMKQKTGAETVLLAMDINMRNVARAYGLTAKLPFFKDDFAGALL